MEDPRNDELLKKMLAEEDEGKSPPPTAIQGLVRRFEKRRIRVALIFGLCQLLAALVATAGVCILLDAANTKTLFLSFIVFFFGFECTIMLTLWYWAVDSKIEMQKELRRMELMVQGGGGAAAEAAPEEPKPNAETGWISRLRRWMMPGTVVWTFRLILWGLVYFVIWVGVVKFYPHLQHYGTLAWEHEKRSPSKLERSIAFATDGSSRELWRLVYVSFDEHERIPVDVVYVPLQDGIVPDWRDKQGNKLRCETLSLKDGSRETSYTRIHLPAPLYQNEEFEARAESTTGPVCTRHGINWAMTGHVTRSHDMSVATMVTFPSEYGHRVSRVFNEFQPEFRVEFRANVSGALLRESWHPEGELYLPWDRRWAAEPR